MVLSKGDSEIFLAVIQNSPLPPETLKGAIKEHQDEY